MDGLEHKDERLHAAEGSDWRDKLARLRRDLPADENAEGDGDGDRDGG